MHGSVLSLLAGTTTVSPISTSQHQHFLDDISYTLHPQSENTNLPTMYPADLPPNQRAVPESTIHPTFNVPMSSVRDFLS
jgi:hypothetical protein